jgi:spore maturation protein SpmA
MALNYVWLFFFFIAFIVALWRLVFEGDTEVFSRVMTSLFDGAKNGFDLSLGLTGIMTLWLGIMKIGERAGMIDRFAKAVSPFFRRLFPSIPQDHPAGGAIMMNFSANMLGLDNAATPLGLKAMQALQTINQKKDTASDAQIMFLVLNTAGLTIIPT